MGLFTSERLENLGDLLLEQLRDLYDAEHRIVDALPKMAEKASNASLREAIKTHLQETKNQIKRLETCFEQLGTEPERETCEATKGLIKEGEEMLNKDAPASIRDAGIIASAQRVEHYEMAAYGNARNLAERLGHSEVARLLQETLDEEGNADKKLTDVAVNEVNPAAQAA